MRLILMALLANLFGVFGIYPFQNTTLPWEERVNDLVMRLTPEEVVNQTITDPAKTGVPRLGIKPYVWSTECERGQVNTNTTAFPHSIGLAAAWSKELVFDMNTAVSSEIRAHWNANRKIGLYQGGIGLSCYSPVINIPKHPLWGRIQETYGECPYLSGTLAQGFITGLHGNHPRYTKVSAGCKHISAYNGPENIPVVRFAFDAKVSMRDWRMTFLPAFKMCVNAGTYSLMCSYSEINGIPACANREMLTNIVRKEWNFTGYVVSDAGAIDFILTQHHYTKTRVDTAAVAFNAGVNLELPLRGGEVIYNELLDALDQGKITEKQLRDNVRPLFYTRMRHGEFDPESMNPYNSIDNSVIQSADHRALAIKAAQMSFTLLKNEKNVLPIKEYVSKLAIVGPFGNNSDQLFGDYSSNVDPQFTTTVLEGLKKLSKDIVSFASGCDNTHCANYNASRVSESVKGSDLVIVALGTGQAVEREGNDRTTLDLPGHQLDLLQDAVYYANGARVILLLFNAGPLDITWAKGNPNVHAIIECYLPAQSTGVALYNTLMATSADAIPAGRVPITWPAYLAQVPSITDYDMMKGSTYRYFNGDPLYPFGYGLSYSTFKYSDLTVMPNNITKNQNITVSVLVMNTGKYAADEVTQIYMSWPINAAVPVPKLQLVGFKRKHLLKNQQIRVTCEVSSEQLLVWLDDKTGWGLLPGKMKVFAGGQQPNQRTAVNSNVLATSFNVSL